MKFRNSAAFGKRMEHWIIGRMLRDGLDVYLPLVDDHAVDALIKRQDGSIAQIQIKARSKDVVDRDAALFAAIVHRPTGKDYWYIFYSERLEKTWLMTGGEFEIEARRNKNGKNVGKMSIWFNGSKKGEEYAYPKFQKYEVKDFSRLLTEP
jgi:hypothetical protein